MPLRCFNLILCLILLVSPCAFAQSETLFQNTETQEAPPTKPLPKSIKPNIVVILADDLGFSDLGCYGSQVETPNLDTLANNGLRYAQFYNTARCWPTRAALLTGYYPQQIGMDPPQKTLPQWTRMLPHYLKTAGYRSYHSGKWHVRAAEDVVAQGGFDRSYKISDQDRFFSPRSVSLDDKNQPPVENDGSFYATEAIGEYGIKFLSQHQEDHADKPFFLYLAFTSPHFPLHALQEDVQKYKETFRDGWDIHREKRLKFLKESGLLPNAELSALESETFPRWNLTAEKLIEVIGKGEVPTAVAWETLTDEQKEFQALKMAIHAAMIDRMDQAIGLVIKQLTAMNALDNTLILFCSDNGASAEQIIRGNLHDPKAIPGSAKSYLCLGPGWSTAANTPFRRHKSWVHEGGISTPLIVHWPKQIQSSGEIRQSLGHVIDIVPTILDVAGVPWNEKWNGTTAPSLAGKSLVPSFAKNVPIEREYLYFSHDGHHALRQGDWKVVSADDNTVDWTLYNIAEDRDESNNLTPLNREQMTKMQLLWNQINRDMRAQATQD
ncbi:MAG: arylsulfatase [Planctomycetaceae bacterium]|jgi:arylsulfatase A-like enzyme|nr:arylsulfatase [Planctomycetaceae bacterium]MDC0274023.1 arylsulfatase [Planctomycetaceae bacterium]MDC0308200.1 arylsulfatase [Planctomycetaceae bacterium]MDG2388083.1 arylsulfatase [Planctomycetaceae bacterium]